MVISGIVIENNPRSFLSSSFAEVNIRGIVRKNLEEFVRVSRINSVLG
jgi:hypothetical protein